MVKMALLAAASGLLLSACGYYACACAAPAPPNPSISPGLGFDAVVTEHDTAITIHTGQKLEVVLHARPGMSNWANVRSSDIAVLSPVVNPAATAVRGVTLAGFEAQRAGQATITASAGAACSPGQACPQFAVLYSVTVTVT
jgi:hypothetical protein